MTVAIPSVINMSRVVRIIGAALLGLLVVWRHLTPSDCTVKLTSTKLHSQKPTNATEVHPLRRSASATRSERPDVGGLVVADPSVTALARILTRLQELAAAGGVYIYRSDELLSAAQAPQLERDPSGVATLFPLSGGRNIDQFSQYGLETLLIRLLQDSPFVTSDPTTAAMFVVPQYATFESHWCMGKGLPLQACSANVSRDYLMPLVGEVQKSSAYKRHNGRDHLWVFPWDAAWDLFPGVPEALATNLYWGYQGPQENVVLTPVTSQARSSLEVMERNTILGGHANRAYATLLLARPGTAVECTTMPPHKYIASFAGTIWESRLYSKGLRQDLLAAYPEAGAPSSGVLILARHVDAAEYEDLLRDSLFCLSPQGWTPWSQRLYSAIAAGCIPVFFDMPGFNVQLPHADLLPWSEMSITVPVEKAGAVHNLLAAISPATVCRMRGLLSRATPFLMWGAEPHTALMATLSEAWERVANNTGRRH